jgi:hypothetical protein
LYNVSSLLTLLLVVITPEEEEQMEVRERRKIRRRRVGEEAIGKMSEIVVALLYSGAGEEFWSKSSQYMNISQF